jgi:amino acid adenylation domain-containing protein
VSCELSEACGPPEVEPCDPAYIFFTSGSTGVPKAVLGVHRSLSHFLNWQRHTFQVGPSDRVAQLSGLSFDVVLRDVFLPLTSGATVCLPEETEGSAPDQVLPWLQQARITLLHTVPSLAQSWLAASTEPIDLKALRIVFFAGEPLSEGLVRRWREGLHFKGTIVNLYGPTETTLVKCFFEVPTPARSGVQPVGRPLPDTQAIIMRGGRQLCGIGEMGEIVLRTPFRSLGYANSPQETQKYFIVNPFRQDESDLLYLTGDQGRYLPDGSLEILGRIDHQVKIRGVRIEPEEISAILQLHPAVRSSVVVPFQGDQDSPVLVAYVVAAATREGLKNELRRFLLQQLPATMIPSRFEFIERMPLTPNGKLDRRALPLPDLGDRRTGQTRQKPRNPIEEELAAIWSDVLKTSNWGIYDDFFELGGHSLLATQVISRIGTAFRISLPLRTLFESPTVADLADTVLKRLLEELDTADSRDEPKGIAYAV